MLKSAAQPLKLQVTSIIEKTNIDLDHIKAEEDVARHHTMALESELVLMINAQHAKIETSRGVLVEKTRERETVEKTLEEMSRMVTDLTAITSSTEAVDRATSLRYFAAIFDIDTKLFAPAPAVPAPAPHADEVAETEDEEEEEEEPRLHEMTDICKAITNKKQMKLLWRGFLLEHDVTLDPYVLTKIDTIRTSIAVAHHTRDQAACEGLPNLYYGNWHLQVYTTPGKQTAMLLTSPNGAYFWKMDGLRHRLTLFFKSPNKFAEETKKKLREMYEEARSHKRMKMVM